MVYSFGINADSEPASAEVLGNVADLSRDDFQRAIKIADKGYRKYSTSTSFPERAAQLYRWYELIHANLEDCNPIGLTVPNF
jgi:acyl-CoA reductase-like NAD-dependent aldehyde dehydrogenase